MSELFAAIEAAAALHQSGRRDEAQAAYEALLPLAGAPRPTLLQLLALLHTEANRLDAALQAYAALVAEGHGSPAIDQARAALNDRALQRQVVGRLEDALADYDAALALAPGLAVAWSNRSVALRRLGRREAARASAEQAVSLSPGAADAWNTLGLARSALNGFEAALDAFDRALQLKPGWAETLNNAALASAAMGRLDAAEAGHRAAAERDPANGAYGYNLALVALRRGAFEAGWRGYERRWRRADQPGPTYPDATLWLGEEEDLSGRTLLLHAEQGLGDTLQFCRYAPLARAAGARVVLEVQPALAALMRTLAGVDEIRAIDEPPPVFDRHTPLMSLPLALRAFAPDDPRVSQPYLHANPHRVETWRQRLGEDGRRKVGLVWAGNPAHQNDHNRSIPLTLLEPLVQAASEAGVELVSLQTPLSEGDRARLAAWSVRELGSVLGDFSETAALLLALDLLIAVDTSITHLAGALGRPAWLLLPTVGDWRWGDQGERTLWYPSLRLFRQPRPDAWPEAIAAVAAALSGDAAPGGTAPAGPPP